MGENKEKLGNKTTVKIEKTKFGAPFKENSFNIIYKEGIDKYNELLDLAHEYEVVKVWGKQVTELFGDSLKYTKDEFIQCLKEQPDFFENIKTKVIEKSKVSKLSTTEDISK
jgi:recombination protein RecA